MPETWCWICLKSGFHQRKRCFKYHRDVFGKNCTHRVLEKLIDLWHLVFNFCIEHLNEIRVYCKSIRLPDDCKATTSHVLAPSTFNNRMMNLAHIIWRWSNHVGFHNFEWLGHQGGDGSCWQACDEFTDCLLVIVENMIHWLNVIKKIQFLKSTLMLNLIRASCIDYFCSKLKKTPQINCFGQKIWHFFTKTQNNTFLRNSRSKVF